MKHPVVPRRTGAVPRWPRSLVRSATVLLAALLAVPVPAQNGADPEPEPVTPAARAPGSPLPNLGDSSDMSPAAERKLGDRIAHDFYRDPDYIDDPVIMEYVQSIWLSLIAASRARGEMPDALYDAYAWDILMVRDRTVNAFALPGGYFGLYLGLVSIVTTRDELASVLGHELSHVTQRHISRTIARQKAQAPWMIGAMVLGMLTAAKNASGGTAMLMGSQAAGVQSQLNYSRGMEREADRIGFNVSTQAGFAPQGFVSMFEKLQASTRLNDYGGFPYLRTHPLTTERIADMQNRVHQSPVGAQPTVATQESLIMAARARILANPEVDALRVWQQQALPVNLLHQPVESRIAALYGATLAALRLRDFALAEATLGRLQHSAQIDPTARRLATLLEVELALEQQQAQRALQLAQGLDRQQRASLLLWARTVVLYGPAQEAAQVLQTWLVDHPRDAQAWLTLAGAYNVQGRTVAAVRAEAEASVAEEDYAGALARLRSAQDLVHKAGATVDYFDASIVDTRLHEVSLLVKEQASEH